jgi:hypothetical protein
LAANKVKKSKGNKNVNKVVFKAPLCLNSLEKLFIKVSLVKVLPQTNVAYCENHLRAYFKRVLQRQGVWFGKEINV